MRPEVKPSASVHVSFISHLAHSRTGGFAVSNAQRSQHVTCRKRLPLALAYWLRA